MHSWEDRMPRPRFFVDGRRSVPFETLEAARAHAQQNLPSVILEWRETPEGPAYVEIARFDWHWDEARGMPVVGFC